ncbi:peptidylprolyl isomerase [Rathayibacter sp. YIM 133350]|uniref:peptidylprolyl isomerase n=1 Tax=Rathayibacter sp. YIM 133350 TaxID=3131992 RepID=UPI00307F7DEA
MASNNRQDREARAARQRLRAYQARQKVHEHRARRRVRDNIIAGVVALVVLVLAVGAQLAYFTGGPGTPPAATTAAPTPTPTPTAGQNTGDVPPASLAEARTWTGSMTLNGVPLGFELDGAAAPQAVASTVSLVKKGFYEGLTCHRLTTSPGFSVLQCGDPKGDGSGGPGYSYGPVENAPADNVYPAGTIAMARQGGNAYSMGSQFFIVYGDTTIPADAAGGYTVLGHITSGLDQLTTQITSAGTSDGSQDGPPAVPVTMSAVTVQ